MITIKDVAQRAGVSKTTVSRIINNQGSFNFDISHFETSDLPIVSIGRKISPEIPAVSADNRMAGMLAGG